jgi:tetratricopeptide (TPR) repeat protein
VESLTETTFAFNKDDECMQIPIASELSLFYAYVPEDREFCVALDKHLAVMKRLGWIRTWYDRAIEAEQLWADEISRHLSTAEIVLLLISSDFLASDYCSSAELKYALKRQEMGEAVVVPIILRPVDWSMTPFYKLQALPRDGKAVVSWANRDEAFFALSEELKLLIEQRRQGRVSAQKQPVSSSPFWTVPYRQNPFFAGREDILEQISAHFSTWNSINTPVAALNGLGGIGKTQIALEYVYRSVQSYQATFWLNASSQETFLADVLALADALAFLPMRKQEPLTMVSIIKQWLGSHSQWILVLDAVSDLSLVAELIPVRSSGHVLLTTQAPVSRTYASSFEVDKLCEPEALEFLLRRAGLLSDGQALEQADAEDVRDARHICHALDGLPLALDQAGAYIEETGCSLAEYYHRYQQQQLAILSLRGNTLADHPASVVTTWSLSFEYLEPQDTIAADLLRCCAFLAPDVIPQQIFLRGAAHLGPHLASFLKDEIRFDTAIQRLRQFAFVRRFSQVQTISLHRLVQVVLRSQMERDVQSIWAERVIQALAAAFPHKKDQEWVRCALYIPHVYVCEKLLEDYHLDCPAAGALFYRSGRFFHDHAQYIQAEYLYLRALTLRERLSTHTESEGLTQILDSLGWLALDQGQFAQAEPLFRRARTLKEQIYGYDHLETAITLHALGRLAHIQYQYREAETLYQQALQIKQHTVGDDHAETATTFHTLGWLLYDHGKYDAALPYYQKALAIRSKVLGTKHLSTAITLHELARLAHRRGQYEQAEHFYLQSLSAKEEALGPQHPFLAIAMDALASLYQDQGRAEEAKTWYQRALALREQCFGPEHQFTAEIIHHLACLYQDQGQFQQAEFLLLRALSIRERTLGSEHPITAISTHQLARLYSAQQRWTEAETYFLRTLAIREQAFGLTHPAMQSIMRNYTQFLRSLQRDAEAQALEQQWLNKKDQISRNEHKRLSNA